MNRPLTGREGIIGLDIGGANIKYCTTCGRQGNVPFELWKSPERLASFVSSIPEWQNAQHVGITMTGELADCFDTKAQGVEKICQAVGSIANEKNSLAFYQTSGYFVEIEEAIDNWRLTAASNWHALAHSVGFILPDCLVIDLGSTTLDLIPVRNGNPAAKGNTDLTRLAAGELIYTGVVRSPVCAVAREFAWNGISIPLAHEYFSNMLDVYLIRNQIAESTDKRHTADSRPADKQHAYARLSRMICADRSEIKSHDIDELANQVALVHRQIVESAIARQVFLPGSDQIYAVLGEGAFLVKQILHGMTCPGQIHESKSLARRISGDISFDSVDTALAIALLYQRHLSV